MIVSKMSTGNEYTVMSVLAVQRLSRHV